MEKKTKTKRKCLAAVSGFKKFWKQEGPFLYCLCSNQFPDELLRMDEWIFSDKSIEIFKELFQWKERKLRIISAQIAKKKKDDPRYENIIPYRINNFPSEWSEWECDLFFDDGFLKKRVMENLESDEVSDIEKSFFRELEEEIENFGYSFFKPSKDEPFADTKEYIKEWLEDEELDGGDFSSS